MKIASDFLNIFRGEEDELGRYTQEGCFCIS